jgi:hypothetical protein
MSGVRTFIRVFHIVKYNYVIYLEYHSVCPLVRIGGPPTPSLAGEEVGGSQFGRLEKRRTLSTL